MIAAFSEPTLVQDVQILEDVAVEGNCEEEPEGLLEKAGRDGQIEWPVEEDDTDRTGGADRPVGSVKSKRLHDEVSASKNDLGAVTSRFTKKRARPIVEDSDE